MHQIYTDFGEKPADLPQPCGVWIYGEPGCGKTTAARTEYGTYYSKPCNKWWDGFDPSKHNAAVIDDIDPRHNCLAHHVKEWCDKWSFTGEVKCGTRSLRPQVVIITSNYSIDEVFKEAGPVCVDAITRRCKIIHMHKSLSPMVTERPAPQEEEREESPDIEVSERPSTGQVVTPGQRRMFLDIQN